MNNKTIKPPSSPVIQNNPFLTVIWQRTEIEGYIGPDITISLTVDSGNKVKGTEKTKNN